MKYRSTRGDAAEYTASQAILKGIASDGGLFVPVEIPKLDVSLEYLVNLNYNDIAYEVLKLYLTDYSPSELKNCIEMAYDDKFDNPLIAPLVKAGEAYFLELFHGKTLAFKDMALSILPHLLKTASHNTLNEKEIVILTATSGDTGKAALEGFKDVDGTRIIVFYPEDGVSPLQKKQMQTQEGSNTFVVGVRGNFDDTQTAVKKIFTDREMLAELDVKNMMFSSANSINIGRLVPQIAYYFFAYSQLVAKGDIQLGEKINFVVPTGNFGNILAGFYAKQMGLPIEKLVCASNENKVLYDFFHSAIYDTNRKFILTTSPSMDILVSSNLERLLYHGIGSAAEVKNLMTSLNNSGKYQTSAIFSDFAAYYATESETQGAILKMYQKTGYIMDTHTAVAYAAYEKYSLQSEAKTIIISTASPYKFSKAVMSAIDEKYSGCDDFSLLAEMSALLHERIPAQIFGIENKPVLHKTIIDKSEMRGFVQSYVNRKPINK